MTIEVNNKKVEAKKGEYILQALRRAGVYVPTLCNFEGLPPTGACRMCVVEIEGMNGLIPSCAFPVQDGMKVHTHTQKVVDARKTILELLLANHPDDCLYCSRNHSCELQDLSHELGVHDRRYEGARMRYKKDTASPSIVRDPEKCILCGRCVRVCEEVQGIAAIDFIGRGSRSKIGTAFDEGINVSSCVNCGQCIVACPTGALTEQNHIDHVLAALADPEKMVVVQHAPAVSVTLGEEFNMKQGEDIVGKMVAALRKIGFDRVFETSFAADLTIMEEAAELVNRIGTNGKLPMMTSCSPAWVKFVEQEYPDLIENLSTCKSPQQMMGAVIKTYFAGQIGVDPKNIYSVAVMPCTAKKFEAGRFEMGRDGYDDIDAVLTTRELAKLIKIKGIDMFNINPEYPDTPFGERSSAGKLFGASGGVMEAALRTAHYMITGKELPLDNIKEIRGMGNLKEFSVEINGIKLNCAVANGLDNAKKLMDMVQSGKKELHFIEVMSCPGGCVGGGGQPIGINMDAVKKRMKSLYDIDKESTIRASHKNLSVQKLYDEFLGKPLGHKSHELLHTEYHKRDIML